MVQSSGVPTGVSYVSELRDQFRNVVPESSSRFSQRPPAYLFHYTTFEGFLGIVESDSIWASDARFMNDSSELSYARNFILSHGRSVISSLEDEDIRQTGLNAIETFARGAIQNQALIACFCEEADLLSQWRGYGASGGSASLALDLGALYESSAQSDRPQIVQVVYDQDVQQKCLVLSVRSWADVVARLRSEGWDKQSRLIRLSEFFLQNILVNFALRFKHPTFSEEREWRIIYDANYAREVDFVLNQHESQKDEGDPVSMLQFRTSSLGLIPYVKINLTRTYSPYAGKLPMAEVMLGPSDNPALALESLRIYLDSKGYDESLTSVQASAIPLRR